MPWPDYPEPLRFSAQVGALLERLRTHNYTDVSTHVSFLEVYNERLEDMFANCGSVPKGKANKPPPELKIADDPERGPMCHGLTELRVDNIDTVRWAGATLQAAPLPYHTTPYLPAYTVARTRLLCEWLPPLLFLGGGLYLACLMCATVFVRAVHPLTTSTLLPMPDSWRPRRSCLCSKKPTHIPGSRQPR